ncbi:MAG: hypothetical protein NTY90_01715 [Candidatus Micrarchaeota archaeon]|nr:hypothetical protein [Candidatus Micrarchaeota archaeon]
MVLEFREDPTKKVSIIFSTERAHRPQVFGEEKQKCPFCRGSESMTPPTTFARPNAFDWKVRCFRNAFPLLSPREEFKGLVGPAFGDHEVIVETGEHGALFQDFQPAQLALVLETYKNRFSAMASREGIACVYLFKNHGRAAGASIEHEHAQIVALPFVPELLEREAAAFDEVSRASGKCFYCSLAETEKENILDENQSFYAVCPPFARFPGETWVIPKMHRASMLDFDAEEDRDFMNLLAFCVKKIYETQGHDYVIAFHNAPAGRDFHFHAEIYPRTNTWAGLELGAGLIVNTKSEKDALKELKADGEEEELLVQ